MATASSILYPATVSATGITNSGEKGQKGANNKVVFVSGLNSFGGLKAHNSLASLGLPVFTEECFAKVVNSLKTMSFAKGRGGSALSSTCNATDEIFKIAAIMNGLVLIGVAVGFILLRIESSVEESE